MEIIEFEISDEKLAQYKKKYPNLGKNSDVGSFAVKIAEEFFSFKYKECTFEKCAKGVDLSFKFPGLPIQEFEIKGTVDSNIAWNKLKVSSQTSYNKLINGMPLLRITNIGEKKMNLYILKCGIDFQLEPEARWSVKKL